jgi:adenylate/nucleoside-diphosphate kinase
MLYNEWRKLQKLARRTTATHKIKEQIFISNLHNIFDIAHTDALNILKIEKDK